MNILSIATAISIIALGYFTVPSLRRAAMLRKRGVPGLPRRALPPPLPQMTQDNAIDQLERARHRRLEAMGIADDFGRPCKGNGGV